MTTRIALRALLRLAFALTSVEVRGSVALQSFGLTPSVPGTHVFDSIGPMGPPGAESGPGASVAWPVTVDLALLNTLPLTLPVNFPDRSPVTLARMRSERWSAGTFLWTGRGADCSAIFRMAASGLKGMISCINAPYGIHHPAGSSSLRLTRYDDAGNQIWPEPFPGLPAGAMPSGPAPAPPAGKPDTTVDILVLYNGHLTSTPIWENARDQVIAIQHAMDLSTSPGQPVIAKIRLAGAARISRAVDNAPADDLDALRIDTEVLALRDYWSGDAILYLTTGNCTVPGGVQGIAYLPGY